MMQKLSIKYSLLLLVLILTIGIVYLVCINSPVQHVGINENSVINLSPNPIILTFSDRDVYCSNVRYNSVSNEIEFIINNTSYSYYGFGQISRAYKLINNEWLNIAHDYVFIFDWLGLLPPSKSLDWRFELSLILGDNAICYGTYLFKKPLYQSYYNEDLEMRFEREYSWLYIILEVE